MNWIIFYEMDQNELVFLNDFLTHINYKEKKKKKSIEKD